MGPLARRLPNPTGFVLVAGCFLLPFATASCTARNVPISGSFSGADLVTNHLPTRGFVISVDDAYRVRGEPPPQDMINQIAASVRPIGWQPLLAAALLVVLLGAATGFVRRPWFRALYATAAAVIAAVLLGAGATVVKSAIYDRIGTDLRVLTSGAPPRSFLAVRTGAGVWLALGLLTVLAVGNAVALVRRRRDPDRPDPDRPDRRVYPRTLEYPVGEGPTHQAPDEPLNAGYTTQEFDRERMDATTEERASDTTG